MTGSAADRRAQHFICVRVLKGSLLFAPLRSQVKVPSEVTLQQGAAHHGEEVKSSAIGKCSSCGKVSPGSNFHAVHYKTIIAHFEQVRVPVLQQ